jgi:hypothetical protein
MWNDPTYQFVKEDTARDLSIAKTTDENGFDTYHLTFRCLRQMSGTLAECEKELNKYVRCINKNNKNNKRKVIKFELGDTLKNYVPEKRNWIEEYCKRK